MVFSTRPPVDSAACESRPMQTDGVERRDVAFGLVEAGAAAHVGEQHRGLPTSFFHA